MKNKTLRSSLLVLLSSCLPLLAQTVNTSQQVLLEGLRTNAGAGSFVAARYAADGSLFLLSNQNDGVRVLKADATGATLLAQAQIGAKGDTPVAMALDPAGNLYVTGTTTSGGLKGTQGAAFPAVADSSTNSFLAKYDTNLNLIFLTFLGSGRSAVAAVAATADAALVTGITYNTAFPVTAAGIQQAPASGSSANGFVERFSANGSTLVYATYLTGVGGDTTPAAIAADTADNAYIAGATTASGFPTISALQSTILVPSAGSPSGFLTSLNAAGSAFNYSTFLAGSGLNSIVLDAGTNSLLLSGNVSVGQFPVATVLAPVAATTYQTLLRLPLNGQSVTASVLLVPGSQSHVAADNNGGAWVAGSLGAPLFPGETAPDYTAGDSFLLHVTAANQIDQTLRFGGLPVNNASYAGLSSAVAAPAVSANGTTVAVPGTLTATVDASLLAMQRFDLPLAVAPNAVLPNSLRDMLTFPCTNSSACTGTGGLLAMVTTAASAPSLSLSTDNLPNLTLRNLGSATATGLAIVASGYTAASDCGTSLASSSQCSIALTGTGPGTVMASAANAPAASATLAANTAAPDALALSTEELDFGIVTAVDGAATRSLTVRNLTASPATFTSAKDGGATTAYTIAATAGTCAAGNTAGTYTVAANGSCQLTMTLTASSAGANDGPVRSFWKIGTRDVLLTGFAQAAALTPSATEIDFGTQISGSSGLHLPRYLYLSNNSATTITHNAVLLPPNSPFSVTDNCPSTLEPHSVCQLALAYLSATAPSSDAVTLVLDNAVSVVVTGKTLQPASTSGNVTNPNLSVSATQLSFASPVVVTTVSGTTQTLTVKNSGQAAFTLSLAITGDFTFQSGCASTLAAGASCSIALGFAPSQPGTRDGLLSLVAGSGFAPTLVALSGTGTAILPANNGVLSVGQTFVGEPVVTWYKVQQPLVSLTAASSSAEFGVVLVPDTGNGHGYVTASTFAQSTTAACGNCWLGVQFFSQTAGAQTAQLTLTSAAAGNAYMLTVQAQALPLTGLLLSPQTPDFGTVAIHSSSAPTIFTLANLLTGTASATVQSISVTGDFVLVPNSPSAATCSAQVAPTASCNVEVAFSPTAIGDRTGTLTLVTSGGTVTAALNGFGLADPGVAINPTALTFANVPGATATQQAVQLMNTSQATLTIGALTASDPSFIVTSACATLAPGAVCTVNVGFVPQAATTSGALLIPVSSTVNGQLLSNTYSVALAGAYTTQGAGLEIVTNQVNFGSVATGAVGPTRTFTLNNLSGKALTVAFNAPREFPLTATAPCPTLAAGASCTFAASFLPATGGPITGSLVVTGTPTDGSAAVQTLAYMLGYGAAVGSLSITGIPIPYTPVGFTQVSSGQTSQQTLTLNNTGTGTLNIRQLITQPPFYATSNCSNALAAGQTCAVTLTYAPLDEITTSQNNTPRTDLGLLTVESDAVTSPDTVTLSGTVVPAVSASPANSAVLNAYSLTTGALTFPNTQVGSASAAQTIVLTNLGTTTLHLLSIVPPTDFTASTTCATLLPGATCSLAVTFAPGASSTATTRSGELQLLTDASDALEFVTVVGTSGASPLALSPSTLDFGTVNVGASDSLSLTVTNATTAPVTFSGVSATGDYAASLGTCPATGGSLAAGAACSLSVTFSPTVTGTRTGTLSLETNATPLPLTAALTGVGVKGQLQVTPGALAFGSIDVGSPASLTLTLLNTGTAAVTNIANAIGGSNASAFNVSVPCPVAALAPNQGCTETVTFTPQALGAAAATLTLTSSDPSGPASIALSGTGIAGGGFILSVNGASSASLTVASGSPAVYPLTLTPLNGFTGTVALTCAPVIAGPNATCSLNASSLTLSGSAVNSAATIETISSHSRLGAFGMSFLLGALLLLPKRKNRTLAAIGSAVLLAGICFTAVGCGGAPPSKVLYTPAGTYQYTVTASSTSGVRVASSVTLNVIVQ